MSEQRKRQKLLIGIKVGMSLSSFKDNLAKDAALLKVKDDKRRDMIMTAAAKDRGDIIEFLDQNYDVDIHDVDVDEMNAETIATGVGAISAVNAIMKIKAERQRVFFDEWKEYINRMDS